MERKLRPKQQLFADEWMKDRNATQAAIRCGYSPRSAQVHGSRLLSNDMVSAYLKKKTQSIADKLGIDAEYVLSSMKQIGKFTMPTRAEANPTVALKSLELLGKHLKLFEEDDKKQTNITINVVQF